MVLMKRVHLKWHKMLTSYVDQALQMVMNYVKSLDLNILMIRYTINSSLLKTTLQLMKLLRMVSLMDKEEIKNIITDMFKNLDVSKVESINIDSGTYDDGSTYTQVNIDYVEGGESE